ncbi:MAG: helix-turn-helix transcriptional regulator [Bacteroides sp.]|nr:helix-turn-helix transcriptional regulator [Bacteroides sp.]
MEENLKEIGDKLRYKECPELYRNIIQIQDTLDVLSGKWKIPILFAILKGHSRFSDIVDFCPGITDKVLNNRLKDLIDNKIIAKRGYDYIMTEHGVSLYRVIQELWRWGCRHRYVMLGEELPPDVYSEQLQ